MYSKAWLHLIICLTFLSLFHPSWHSSWSMMCFSTPWQGSRGPSGPRSRTSGMRARWPRVFDISCFTGYTRNTVSTAACCELYCVDMAQTKPITR